MSESTSSWTEALDRVGVYASAACFVHCMAMPVVLSLMAVYAHLLRSEEHTHRVLAVLVTLVGAMALMGGYRRHRRAVALVLMAAGIVLIVGGAFFGDRLPGHWAEMAITMAGSCCMIVAHRRNHTFCGSCVSCEGKSS
jgi:uncharacterized membrane protein YfcA